MNPVKDPPNPTLAPEPIENDNVSSFDVIIPYLISFFKVYVHIFSLKMLQLFFIFCSYTILYMNFIDPWDKLFDFL